MAKLYVIMGAPGSGKSTFIKNTLSKYAFVISRDTIRFGMVKEHEPYKQYQSLFSFVDV